MPEEAVGTVFIGKKPLMNYVFSCITSLQGGSTDVVIKARGKAISKAVDVTQLLQNRFIKDIKIKDIKFGTEQVTGEDNRPFNVSTIEIKIGR